MQKFKLSDDDRVAIAAAIKVALRLLKHPGIKPRQIVGLGNALHALERLPLVTPGASTEFGVVHHAGTKDSGETRYIVFEISESAFSITTGGTIHKEGEHRDRFSKQVLYFDRYGLSIRGREQPNLENSVEEYLNLGAEITVGDESEIDWDSEDEADETKEYPEGSMTPEQIQVFIDYLNSQLELQNKRRDECIRDNARNSAYELKLEIRMLRDAHDAFLRVLNGKRPRPY